MTTSATKKVAYNTLVQSISKGMVLVIGAVSIGILTRYLGPAGMQMSTESDGWFLKGVLLSK